MKFEFLKKLNRKVVIIVAVAALLAISGVTVLAVNLGNHDISEEEAKKAAFSHAGVTEEEVLSLRISKDREDGRAIYDIDFTTAERSYDYDILRSSGEVLQSSFENNDRNEAGVQAGNTETSSQNNSDTASSNGNTTTSSSAENTASAVTQEQAKSIALENAGVSEADTQFLWVKEDYDDGRAVYEVEFYANGTEYDYQIAKDTGAILSSDYDIENYAPNTGGNTGDVISVEEARSLALAKVSGATENDIRINLENDDGRQIYEGEIYYNQMEYEFAIDASTGNIIEWSADRWD